MPIPPSPNASATGGAASASTRPYIGGQAVIEGVMMRSPGSYAVVCRRRSGELVVRERPMGMPTGMRTWPLLRGVATVVESLRLGSSALRFSADLYEQDLEAEDRAKETAGKSVVEKVKDASVASALGIVAMVTQADGEPAAPLPAEEPKSKGVLAYLPLVFALGLFVALPQLAAEGIDKALGLGLEVTSAPFQAITGASKLFIVVGYLLLIRRVAEIRRVFEFHGAEHKTISTYEAGEELLVENARRKTTLHPRCGTTFLVMVALVSIIVFSIAGAFLPVLPGGRVAQSVGFFFMKLPLLPFIAAITYEIQRVFARYCTVGPLRLLLWPGFLVQKITTAEPDDGALEVALGSLRATLWREEKTAAEQRADRTFPSYEALLADPGYV